MTPQAIVPALLVPLIGWRLYRRFRSNSGRQRLTKLDFRPTGNYYTPNTYLGATLSAILVARLIYRFFILGPAAQMSYQQGGDPFATYSSNPLTLLILMLTVGYYLAYNAGLLWKARTRNASS
jgi:hypothetical protein